MKIKMILPTSLLFNVALLLTVQWQQINVLAQAPAAPNWLTGVATSYAYQFVNFCDFAAIVDTPTFFYLGALLCMYRTLNRALPGVSPTTRPLTLRSASATATA